MVDTTPILFEQQAIIDKLEVLSSITKNYLVILETRSKIEANYAKRLKSQTTTPLKISRFDTTNPIDLMESSMAILFKEINTQGSLVSDVHQETSERLISTKNDLEIFIKNYETEKKRILVEIEKKVQIYENNIKIVEKQKGLYNKICQDLDCITKELNNALSNNTQPIDKLVQKKQLLVEKQQHIKECYIESVKKANECRKIVYLDEMPSIISSALSLIQQIYEKLSKTINTIIIGIESLNPVIAKEANIFKIELDDMNFEKDLEEFTKKTKTLTEIKPLELEIDNSVQFLTHSSSEVSNKKIEPIKLIDETEAIFKMENDDVEDVSKMMKQQEEMQESPRPKTPEEFNAEIVDGELIDLS
ncbi:hypothetical protein EHI8A_030450 [Entamoeba histolytica HM-1:IMSS-B]|uniref:F-BAR domain-containing protein n=6 Tax=Entamoeba histolytica TaxID=5759 RepID=C4LSH5_ENTH1|nr:hypothetical protein EHI_151320 [Entamoeba histolytica HM-1:IMSS]EMD42885.1 Hypothetical protein EHI5A_061320 [Entamoeba histolytica KU27]EMH74367.1 hypothetical protein EHI8A_030450 [Entamoeba histolytica HM-1:IMSS-B]EMS17141.1 hypothetical protein KM1_071440 [Entamoeba histolytica HM-3:IMSS]ENY63462.1 hypothetical protein EHI7A_032890 [Entamoeba histolytica HM-1:IMSS-A]GAT91379.1 hypothetical protein CL6EHI_151320 [Entamoeba histolytica]|eukprot:XP_657436.1 hypothetical protein EHI_151320 [Entamoeba histolytica HM-1:IMSS]